MISVSKKALFSLQALAVCATLLTGVSAFGMATTNSDDAEKNDAAKYDLNDRVFRFKFSMAYNSCQNREFVESKPGERYSSDQDTCKPFLQALSSLGSVNLKDMHEVTNKAYHATELEREDSLTTRWAKDGREDAELVSRELLRMWERNAIDAGFSSLVKPETLEEKNRIAYLEYKKIVRENEEAAKSTSNNNNAQ